MVTSPPYWGLRDYSIEPSIWGGDVKCDHAFSLAVVQTEIGRGNWSQAVNGRGEVKGSLDEYREPERSVSRTGFCSRCSAWLGALGLEPSPDLFVEHIVTVFREVQRVLCSSGSLWLNMGDCYVTKPQNDGSTFDPKYLAGRQRGKGNRCNRTDYPEQLGLKNKDMVMMPARVALALQADGWYLRQQIPWLKKSSMPESVSDRPTGAIEYVYLFSKTEDYYYDREGVRVMASGSGHSRGGGVNPKAKLAGPNSRINRDRDPDHQTTAKVRAKQNRSFSAAVTSVVETRARRNSDWLFASLESYSREFQGLVVNEAADPVVLVVNPEPFTVEMCGAGNCGKIYDQPAFRELLKLCDGCGMVNAGDREVKVCVDCGGDRFRRQCDCGSTSWISHFATFPSKLVEPMLLAGTSRVGACPHCGAPYERILEKGYVGNWHPDAGRGSDRTVPASTGRPGKHDRGAVNGISKVARVEAKLLPSGDQFSQSRISESTSKGRSAGKRQRDAEERTGDKENSLSLIQTHDYPFLPPKTLGWRPTCEHASNLHLFTDSMEPMPCVVFDPFSGSGRTGLVAVTLGLDYIGAERNPNYAKMSTWIAEKLVQKGALTDAS